MTLISSFREVFERKIKNSDLGVQKSNTNFTFNSVAVVAKKDLTIGVCKLSEAYQIYNFTTLEFEEKFGMRDLHGRVAKTLMSIILQNAL